MLAAAAGQSRTGSVIEIGALRALALAACGDQDAAVDALARALALGGPQGYVRVFADEGAPMRALLARLAAAQRDQRAPAGGIDAGYLAALLRACGQADAVPPRSRAAAAPPGMIEPLTDRELEVLRLIAAGQLKPAHRPRTVRGARHGQKARDARPGQARRGQPHRGRRAGPAARPDPLTPHPGRPGSTLV